MPGAIVNYKPDANYAGADAFTYKANDGQDSNIANVSLEPGDSSAYTIIHFTLQVSNRLHLAQIMRGLRRLPEVIRINRLKG